MTEVIFSTRVGFEDLQRAACEHRSTCSGDAQNNAFLAFGLLVCHQGRCQKAWVGMSKEG
jgi:hypothetical protein